MPYESIAGIKLLFVPFIDLHCGYPYQQSKRAYNHCNKKAPGPLTRELADIMVSL